MVRFDKVFFKSYKYDFKCCFSEADNNDLDLDYAWSGLDTKRLVPGGSILFRAILADEHFVDPIRKEITSSRRAKSFIIRCLYYRSRRADSESAIPLVQDDAEEEPRDKDDGLVDQQHPRDPRRQVHPGHRFAQRSQVQPTRGDLRQAQEQRLQGLRERHQRVHGDQSRRRGGLSQNFHRQLGRR